MAFIKKMWQREEQMTIAVHVKFIKMPVEKDCELQLVFKRGTTREESERFRVWKNQYITANDTKESLEKAKRINF